MAAPAASPAAVRSRARAVIESLLDPVVLELVLDAPLTAHAHSALVAAARYDPARFVRALTARTAENEGVCPLDWFHEGHAQRGAYRLALHLLQLVGCADQPKTLDELARRNAADPRRAALAARRGDAATQ